MTKKQIIQELKRLKWKVKQDRWYCPWKKTMFQGISLREAASIECLLALENLS